MKTLILRTKSISKGPDRQHVFNLNLLPSTPNG